VNLRKESKTVIARTVPEHDTRSTPEGVTHTTPDEPEGATTRVIGVARGPQRRTVPAVKATLRALLLTFLLLPTAGAASADAPDDDPARILVAVDGDTTAAMEDLRRSGLPDGTLDRIETLEELDTLVVPANDSARVVDLLGERVEYTETDGEVRKAVISPDDPYHEYNWGMQVSDVDDTWNHETGNSNVVIAIIDTGVTETPDLAGRVAPGYDFVNDDNDATDDEGHGTQSAIVAAAAGNDSYGVAGACWGCTVLPVKVLGASGSGSYSDVAAGIIWAADNGADVINLSLGGPSASQTMTAAVEYARNKGALVIAAAGNDGLNQISYPAAIPGVLGVAANNSAGQRYSWSNYHTVNADLSAPGCLITEDPLDGGWYWFCGTSAATPLVAGAAGLLLSEAPWAKAADLERALRLGGRHLPGIVPFVADGTLDADAARAALLTVDTTAPTISIKNAPSGHVRGQFTVTVNIADDRGVKRVDAVSANKVIASSVTPAGTTRMGTETTLTINSYLVTANTITLRAIDLAGNSTGTNITIVPDNTPPTLAIVSPSPSQHLRETVTVTVTTSDTGSGLDRTELWHNATKLAESSTAPWSLTADTRTITDGLHSIEVRAFDKAGNRTSRTRTWRVDNTAPTLTATWPHGEWLRGRLEIGFTAVDQGGVVAVELLRLGTVVARANPANTGLFWNSFQHNGESALTLRAVDRAGNTTTIDHTIKTDNVIPSASGTLNAKTSGTTTLGIVGSDNVAITGVHWWLQSATGVSVPVLLGEGSGANWTLQWNSTTTANGPARIRADVRDAAGNIRSIQMRTTITN